MQAQFVEEMAARVRSLASARNFSAKSLGDALGIPSSSASNYWTGKRPWPLESITHLADIVGTDLDHLLRGGPAETVRARLKNWMQRSGSGAGVVEVAGIDLNFGLGGAFMDQEVVEYQAERLEFPQSWLRTITTSPADQLYWSRGVGNSMEPNIGDGDVILIDRSKVGSSFGDLYWAIAYGQTGMIKRLRPMPDGSVKILSDNPAVPPEVAYDGELHVFGRVIAVIRKI